MRNTRFSETEIIYAVKQAEMGISIRDNAGDSRPEDRVAWGKWSGGAVRKNLRNRACLGSCHGRAGGRRPSQRERGGDPPTPSEDQVSSARIR